MLKSKYPILALLLVTVLSTRFEDILSVNRQTVSSLWANGVSLNINGQRNIIDMIASDITPIVWNENSVIAAYVKRAAGKALILPRVIIEKLFYTTPCDAFCQQWRNVLFNTATVNTEEVSTYLARPKSKRSKETILIVKDDSTGFNVNQLLKDWEAGVVGPLVLQHSTMSEDGPKNKLSEMAFQMGFFFSADTVNIASPITGLTYEPVRRLMPMGLILQAWTDNATTLETYPPRFFPVGDNNWARLTSKFPLYAEDLFRFIQMYDSMFQDHQVNQTNPFRAGATTHPFTMNFYRNYIRQSFSQALQLISKERLESLTYNYGASGAFLDQEDLIVPSVDQYSITLNCRSNINIPLGLDQKPHSVFDYEIVTQTNERMDIGVGAFYDSLSDQDTMTRVPNARCSETMQKRGRFYSPIGGPIVVRPGNFRGELVIKVRNVYRSPGIDIRDELTSDIWDAGTFNNTKARFATLLCDVIFFTVQYDVIKNYSSQNLRDICKTQDHIVKSFDNYVGTRTTLNRERLHMVFDVQPQYGWAHAGQPIVCPLEWAVEMMGITNFYMRQTSPGGFWGFLHEIGHMFQPGFWDFGVFGETTNNFLVLMFQDRYLHMPLEKKMAHPQMYEMSNLFNWINNDNSGMDRVWPGLHFHYHLIPSFGWGLFGNVYNRYMNETNPDSSFDRFTRYLSEESGYNLAPYTHYFRMSDLAKNITAVYQEYSHLPTYKPNDYILNSTLARWEKTRELFGFTNDVQVNETLPFKFNPDLNFDINSPASPSIQEI